VVLIQNSIRVSKISKEKTISKKLQKIISILFEVFNLNVQSLLEFLMVSTLV
jgi:hypothetical protein